MLKCHYNKLYQSPCLWSSVRHHHVMRSWDFLTKLPVFVLFIAWSPTSILNCFV